MSDELDAVLERTRRALDVARADLERARAAGSLDALAARLNAVQRQLTSRRDANAALEARARVLRDEEASLNAALGR